MGLSEKCVSHNYPSFGDNKDTPVEVNFMSTSSTHTTWLHELLQAHLTPEEYKQMESFIHTETWASPSALKREWLPPEEIPLRFTLEIDIQC